MQALIFITDQCALAAVCQFLTLNSLDTVTSEKQFKEIVKSYVSGYGDLCIDDHKAECERFAQAEEITNKYYR